MSSITYESIKGNKRIDSNSPRQQWAASSQADIKIFNELPKTVQWRDGMDNDCVARLDKDGQQYTVKATGEAGSRNRKVHYKEFLRAMPTMPNDAAITPFSSEDIVWI